MGSPWAGDAKDHAGDLDKSMHSREEDEKYTEKAGRGGGTGKWEDLSEAEKNAPPVRVGDRVRIRPEWRDDTREGDVEYVVVEERGNRLLVEAQLGMKINPTQNVRRGMVELVKRPAKQP